MTKRNKAFVVTIGLTNKREKTLYGGVGLCAIGRIDNPDWYFCFCLGMVFFYVSVGVCVPFAAQLMNKPCCYDSDTGHGRCKGICTWDATETCEYVYTSVCDDCRYMGKKP